METAAATATARPRDAARTRGLLLEAARRRFAGEGYAATTVRHVAEDAGVNVALINRYFGSKQGLFEACLEAAVAELRSAPGSGDLPAAAARIASQAAGPPQQPRGDAAGALPRGPHGDVLLMLLRSSGDADVDALRRSVLHRFSQDLAALLAAERGPAGRPGGADDHDDALLSAQVVLATALGVAVLRASPGLDPLRSASPEQLADVLLRVLRALADA